MKILFSGHEFKYEIEATAKLFIFAERFEFVFGAENLPENQDYIASRLKKGKKYRWLC